VPATAWGFYMKRERQEFLPKARTVGMVIKKVDKEVLVYDRERDKAHCLNPSAAAIWRLCDGKTTTSGLARSLEDETGTRVEERLIWLGLQDLRRSHLLEDTVVWPQQMTTSKGMSRREAVRRMGLGAAILPLVISIAAPTAVQAASCNPKCGPCGIDAHCCSGVCENSSTGCASGRRCA